MEVVGGVGHPLRMEAAVLLVQIDDDVLPVGLVVVDAVKPGAPAVVVVEEPVLKDRPATLAHHPAVVDVLRVLTGPCCSPIPQPRRSPTRPCRGRRRRSRRGRRPLGAENRPEPAVPCPAENVPSLPALSGDFRKHLGAVGQAERLVKRRYSTVPKGYSRDWTSLSTSSSPGVDQPLLAPVGIVGPQAGLRNVSLHVVGKNCSPLVKRTTGSKVRSSSRSAAPRARRQHIGGVLVCGR